MKIKRLYLLGIGLMFTSQFLTSCHDLLEKDPTDSYSETVAWSSESSLDMYVRSEEHTSELQSQR